MKIVKSSLNVFALGALVFALSAFCAQPKAKAESIASVSAKVLNSVVNISVSSQKQYQGGEFDDIQEFMREFFERDFFNGKRPQRKIPNESFASGFVIDEAGYIVTNHHVIDGADEIKVTFSDDTESYKAKVIGIDEKTDLALIKIDSKKPLKYLEFDLSHEPQVGEEVIAVGNPLGLGGTVTKGVISAKTRIIREGFTEYLQTDALINKGNSGGPLCNAMTGKVVGVNTAAMFSQGGGIMGIGFALPASTAQNIIEQLKNKGSVLRGWLGVTFQGVDDGIAKSINLPKADGALVIKVEKDSPAEKAGIRSGDVILKANGQNIDSNKKLGLIVSKSPIGAKIDFELFNQGKKRNASAVIEKARKVNKEIRNEQITKESFGLSVQNRDNGSSGVIVKSVLQRSPACRAGIKNGDIILGINQNQIKGVDDFNKHVNDIIKKKKESLILLVMRGDITSFVTVELNSLNK